MASRLDNFFNFIRKPARLGQSMGVPGTALYGGYIVSKEKDRDLSSHERRYVTYSDILTNTSVVAAGVRYFLNMVSSSGWSFKSAEGDGGDQYSELLESILTDDPLTPWHRIIRRASMFRFYGYGVQEWVARKRDDGVVTFDDIMPRPQASIERWDVNDDGSVNGIMQTSPQTGKELYIPRPKLLYIVDDSLSDSPEGLGIFRQLVSPSRRLLRYENLEGFGFETDLRGIPIGYAPFTELAAMVKDGTIDEEQRQRIEKPILDFIKGHIKTPETGLLLDSKVYESQDDAGRPSNVRQWMVELLQGSSNSFTENAAAIERLNREMARIMGVEQLLLGASSTGSFCLV